MTDESPDEKPALQQMAETWPKVAAATGFTATPPPAPPAEKKAKIRCLTTVQARGFTFARGKIVFGVPLSHAEYLVNKGEAAILEIS